MNNGRVDPKELQAEEQGRIDDAESLTAEELVEKDELYQQGFINWNYYDLKQFIRLSALYGRNEIDLISLQMNGKSPEEVVEYSKVFWNRCNELKNFNDIMAQIRKGEAKIKRRQLLQETLSSYIAQYRVPFHQLKIPYHRIRDGKKGNYSEEHDRFLLCKVNEIGLNKETLYEELKFAMSRSPQFRFDWFIKSRTALELKQRCLTLITAVDSVAYESLQNEIVEKTKKVTIDTLQTSTCGSKEAKVNELCENEILEKTKKLAISS